MYDVIIVGKGPAGVSASLYTVRANMKTLIVGKNESVLRKAEKIENYYGFSEPISGEYLLSEGEKQASRLGVEFLEEDVIAVEKEEFFEVITSTGKFTTKTLLLATGQPQKKIDIDGLLKFEGKGISYCTTCDGFFYRNLKVGVLGWKNYAFHEASELETFTKDITIYTNGVDLKVSHKYEEQLKNYRLNTNKINKLEGEHALQKIVFENGEEETLDGIFVAAESASSLDFAMKLGVMSDGKSITVDKDQKTNLDGLYAAGDCTGGFKQIATAVSQGAIAGKSILAYVKKKFPKK